MTRGLTRPGDVLFTTEAPMGNAAVVAQSGFGLAHRVVCFQLYGAIDPAFLVPQLLSPPFQAMLDMAATGLTARGIKAAKLKRLPIAIPPLEEQKRIVANVDSLFLICSQLAHAYHTAAIDRAHLLDAVLHRCLKVNSVRTESAPQHV